MSQEHVFAREEVFPSWFANRIQDYLSAGRMDLPLSLKSSTILQVVPDASIGIAAVNIEGRWRFITSAIERAHPGGSKGTFHVWAVAEDNLVNNTPDPFTDHTVYKFELRITSGAKPTGEGTAISTKIAEVDWSGTEIEVLRQTRGAVTGAQIASSAFSGSGDLEWKRESSGAWVPRLKETLGAGPVVRSQAKRKIIATEESTTSESFTYLPTEDKVTGVEVAEGDLLLIEYSALWKSPAGAGGGRAAIFLGANQLKVAAPHNFADSAPKKVGAMITFGANGEKFTMLYTSPNYGLVSCNSGAADAVFVNTGQIGAGAYANKLRIEINGVEQLLRNSDEIPLTPYGGICAVERLAAGTYEVGVKFKADATGSPKITAKERILRVWTKSFA